MCLCNYARPDQLSTVITSLRSQSVPVRIVVWDNSPDGTFKDDRADWVIRSSENRHTRHVIYLWQEAETPYVGRMDDDLYLADATLMEDALAELSKLRDVRQMIGAFGVRLYSDFQNYTDGHHIAVPKGHGQILDNGQVNPEANNLPVDLLKGRFILAKQAASVHLNANFRHYHSDLAISGMLADRRRLFHVVGGCFFGRQNLKDREECFGRLLDFPVDEKGYCNREEHDSQRNELSTAWAYQCMVHRKVKRKYAEGEQQQTPKGDREGGVPPAKKT